MKELTVVNYCSPKTITGCTACVLQICLLQEDFGKIVSSPTIVYICESAFSRVRVFKVVGIAVMLRSTPDMKELPVVNYYSSKKQLLGVPPVHRLRTADLFANIRIVVRM